jgi:tetratricopeptide (TPR) repeat protein
MQTRSPQKTILTPQRWQRLQEIFERALPLDAEERSRFLLSECGEDIAMREQVVSLLLASTEDGGEFERRYEDAIAATLRASEAPPGTVVGRYRIVRVLGSGGMGTVHLAERADDQYQQLVALKLVAQSAFHPGTTGRFRSERQILARLNHPNIARLLDGGHTELGTPYLVMEYVDGLRIDQFCDERGLSTQGRLRLIQQVCEAVQYAHQNLIVHRDLKPSNILVTAEAVPKLLDFGIAKLLDRGGADPVGELTRVRDRILTPEYASPEQLRAQLVGTVSDVYGLGVLLYELLTGRRPHAREDRSPVELERAICEEDPPAPSAVVARGDACNSPRLRVLARTLAGDLDNIVLKAMHRDPQRRYASAAALAQDIQNYLDSRPVQARPDTWTYRIGKFVRRNRLGVSSAAGVVVLIAGLATFYTSRLAAQRDVAALEAAKAKQVASFLGGIFRVADPWRGPGGQITAIEILDRGASDVERRLKDEPIILSDLLFEIANSYKGLAAYDRARRMFERSLALKAGAGLANTPEYARELYELANVWRFEGKFAESEQCFERALEIQRRLFHGPSADTSATLTHLGTLYSEMKRWDDALKLQRESLAMATKVFGTRHEETADRMNNLALALEGEGQYAEAEQFFQRDIAIQASVLPPMHPDALGAKSNLGTLMNAMGRYRAAERQLREILPARRTVMGNDHPRVGFTLTALGSVLTSRGEFDEAQKALGEALGIFTEKLGVQHYRTGGALLALGHLALARGEYVRAEDFFRRAESIEAHNFGDTSDGVYRIRTLIAAAMSPQGRAAEAEPLLERSYEKLYANMRPVSAEYDRTLEELAGVRLAHGQLDDAASLYKRALQRYQSFGVPNHPETADALLGLAQVALQRHQPGEAVSLSTRALTNLRGELPENHWKVALARLRLGESLQVQGIHLH